jgi:hypothetical protein
MQRLQDGTAPPALPEAEDPPSLEELDGELGTGLSLWITRATNTAHGITAGFLYLYNGIRHGLFCGGGVLIQYCGVA